MRYKRKVGAARFFELFLDMPHAQEGRVNRVHLGGALENGRNSGIAHAFLIGQGFQVSSSSGHLESIVYGFPGAGGAEELAVRRFDGRRKKGLILENSGNQMVHRRTDGCSDFSAHYLFLDELKASDRDLNWTLEEALSSMSLTETFIVDADEAPRPSLP